MCSALTSIATGDGLGETAAEGAAWVDEPGLRRGAVGGGGRCRCPSQGGVGRPRLRCGGPSRPRASIRAGVRAWRDPPASRAAVERGNDDGKPRQGACRRPMGLRLWPRIPTTMERRSCRPCESSFRRCAPSGYRLRLGRTTMRGAARAVEGMEDDVDGCLRRDAAKDERGRPATETPRRAGRRTHRMRTAGAAQPLPPRVNAGAPGACIGWGLDDHAFCGGGSVSRGG